MTTRADIQNKINTIIKTNPKGDINYIKGQLGGWLDTQDIAFDSPVKDAKTNEEIGSHEWTKNHLLDDLTSYIGVSEEVATVGIQSVEEVII